MNASSPDPRWLAWTRELQALAQTGGHFAQNDYDRERYARLGQIAAEILSAHSNLPIGAVLQYQAAEFGYATPKVDVRGVVFRETEILLVRERADDGRWTLPGGWADVNESPAAAVAREVSEESGFTVATRKLLAVFDREKQRHDPPFPYHVYKLFFLCEIVGGKPCQSDETDGAAFFREDALPELSRSRVTAAEIHRCFEHLRRPSLPADFD